MYYCFNTISHGFELKKMFASTVYHRLGQKSQILIVCIVGMAIFLDVLLSQWRWGHLIFAAVIPLCYWLVAQTKRSAMTDCQQQKDAIRRYSKITRKVGATLAELECRMDRIDPASAAVISHARELLARIE